MSSELEIDFYVTLYNRYI